MLMMACPQRVEAAMAKSSRGKLTLLGKLAAEGEKKVAMLLGF
jgi:hypothetical protein